MIYILVPLIIGVLIGIFHDWNWKDTEEKIGFAVLYGILGGLVGFFILLLAFGFGIARATSPTTTTTEEHELVQITDATYTKTEGNIHGNILVVSGFINSGLSNGFTYYQREGDGYVMRAAESNNTVIKYTNSTPKIVTTSTYCTEKMTLGPWGIENYCPPESTHSENVIYVPEGSVVSDYTLGGGKE